MKFNNCCLVLLIILFGVFLYSNNVNADNSYKKIYTADDLYNIQDDLSGNYILMNDIDLTTVTAPGGKYDTNGRGWEPLGADTTYGSKKPFTGNFNGNGFKIKGMRIDLSDTPNTTEDYINIGLFGYSIGEIRNVNLVNVKIKTKKTEKGIYAGGIAGRVKGVIKNCSVSGSIEVNSKFTTYTHQTYNYDYYITHIYAGGIVGYVEKDSSITYCHNGASVKGIVGDGRTGKRELSFLNYCNVGGIAGKNESLIAQSSNSGSIYGTVTDIKGENGYSNAGDDVHVAGISGSNNSITNCYNKGDIKSDAAKTYSNQVIGSYGIAPSGNVSNCYNVGIITTFNEESNYPICNKYSSDCEHCYFKKGKGEEFNGVIALTENQMLDKTKYEGFDFINTWYMDPNDSYKYPKLLKELDTAVIKEYPTRKEYLTDDELEITGGVIKAYYTDGTNEDIPLTEEMVSAEPLNSPGDKTVTIKYRNFEFTYHITVSQRPDIDDLVLYSLPSKTEFVRDTEFDFSGAIARLKYVDGTFEDYEITRDNTTGGDISKSGEYTITFTKLGYSVSFDVKVIPVMEQGIEITKQPSKLVYIEGESVDLSGIQVSLLYNNGTSKIIDDYTIGDYDKSVGKRSINVLYDDFVASFTVEFKEKSVTAINILEKPKKLNYIQGQKFDSTGMVVEAIYDNQTNEIISDYTVDELTDEIGEQNVAVRYKNTIAYLTVSVIEKEVESISVKINPIKMVYIEGTAFNKAGMVIEAKYNDDTLQEVSDYTIGEMPTEIGEQPIEISYCGKKTYVIITIQEKSITKIQVTSKPKKIVYIRGDKFDPTGLVVSAYYNNGTNEPVTGYDLSGYGSSSSDDNTITVSYEGYTTKFNITLHTMETKWEYTTDPTCTEPGMKVKHCVNCGETLVSEEVSPVGHSFGDWKYQDDNYHQRICSHDNSHIEVEVHNWDDGTVTKKATCTSTGVMTHKCKICGAEKKETIQATSHQWNTNYTIDQEATCLEEGVKSIHCTVCDAKKDGSEVKTDKKAHAWNGGIITKHPTCTENGLKLFTCTVCKESKTEAIKATGHTIVKDPAVAPTYSSSGLTDGSHCSTCGAIIKVQSTIPKLQNAPTEQKAIENDPSSVKIIERSISSIKNDSDPKNSKYSLLQLKCLKATKSSNKLSWKKVNGASGYIVYGNRCGNNYKFKKLIALNQNKKTWTHKKLKKGTYYKYIIVAYKDTNGIQKVLSTSKTIHVATKGGKVGNIKTLKLNKYSLVLKKGKSFKITSKGIPSSKTIVVKNHRKTAYESSNTKIASVTKGGKVKALRKGTCYIYAYGQNGVCQKVRVSVK